MIENDQLRELPSVDLVVSGLARLEGRFPRALIVDEVRRVLQAMRDEIRGRGHGNPASVEARVERNLAKLETPSLRRVINATGVVLHTNLGRAPLPRFEPLAGYSNLEYDVAKGVRGKRDVHAAELLERLVGAPGIAVNNNAAAIYLALNELASGFEVVVSRGELIEIGDGFRIPDIMQRSGAILREVGTTNRTRIEDYRNAINERTRLLLRVHRSNFEITGFTEQASIAELVELAHKRGLPLMEDMGSGALVDLQSFGISGEPSVLESVRAGVDMVTYSGDKLLGGPQAGLLSGRRELVVRMRSNSLFRALRVDKLTYAALEATLLAYVKRDHDAIPTLRMMRLSKEEIGKRAETLAAQIHSRKLRIEIVEGESVIGGGAAPSAVLPTRLLALTSKDFSADELAARLRSSDPPIIVRVDEGRVLVDLRTVFPAQDSILTAALNRIAA